MIVWRVREREREGTYSLSLSSNCARGSRDNLPNYLIHTLPPLTHSRNQIRAVILQVFLLGAHKCTCQRAYNTRRLDRLHGRFDDLGKRCDGFHGSELERERDGRVEVEEDVCEEHRKDGVDLLLSEDSHWGVLCLERDVEERCYKVGM